MLGSKHEEDIAMPSKGMENSIFEKTEIVSCPQILEPNFHISGLEPSNVTKFSGNVWIHVLMLDAKYEEN